MYGNCSLSQLLLDNYKTILKWEQKSMFINRATRALCSALVDWSQQQVQLLWAPGSEKAPRKHCDCREHHRQMGKREHTDEYITNSVFLSAFPREVKQKVNKDYYFGLMIAVDSTGLADVE